MVVDGLTVNGVGVSFSQPQGESVRDVFNPRICCNNRYIHLYMYSRPQAHKKTPSLRLRW